MVTFMKIWLICETLAISEIHREMTKKKRFLFVNRQVFVKFSAVCDVHLVESLRVVRVGYLAFHGAHFLLELG